MMFNNRNNKPAKTTAGAFYRNSVLGKCLAAFLTALFLVCVTFACRAFLLPEKADADTTASGTISASNFKNGEKTTLSGNVTATADITLGSGTYVLDLNDHVFNLFDGEKGHHIILSSGAELTIVDNAVTKTSHTINGYNGSAVTSKVTVTGGVITGGSAENSVDNKKDGGAISLSQNSSSTLILESGTIAGNYSSDKGGAVYVAENCTFKMSGGTIAYNYAKYGGGVSVNAGTFNLSGGKIVNNNAGDQGGGVQASNGAYINLSGDPVITGNTKGDGDNQENCNVQSYIELSVSDMKDGADIRIYGSGSFAAADGDYSQYFISDSGMKTKYVDGKLEITSDPADLDVASVSINNGEAKKYGTIKEAWTAAYNTTATLTLLKTVTVAEALDQIPATGKVTLDLNGLTLDLNQTHIEVIGTLTIEDGTIKNGSGANGGAILVTTNTNGNKGTVTLENGTITESSATNGGGVYVTDGSFTLKEGGEISANSATNGGGVYVYGGSFTMENGAILNNTASTSSGGVYKRGPATVTISGGEISGNNITSTSVLSGGIGVGGTSSPLTISGSPKITGNTVNGSTPGNVYLINGAKITVNGNISGAKIGISVANVYDINNAVTSGYNGNANYKNIFSADQSDKYTLRLGTDNQVYLAGFVASVSVSSGDPTKYGTIEDAWASARDISSNSVAATVTLLANVTAANVLTVAYDDNIILNLSNYTLDLDNKYNISVSGKLTVQDSTNKNGAITKGNGTNGGAISVAEGGTFTMESGNITDSSATNGGGVFIAEGGTFKMTGGVIKSNTAISGGGVYVNQYSTFEIEESACVMGNSNSDDTTINNNVYLYNSDTAKITVTGELLSQIGVTLSGGYDRTFTSGYGANNAFNIGTGITSQIFIPDDLTKNVTLDYVNGNLEVALGTDVASVAVKTGQNSDGTPIYGAALNFSTITGAWNYAANSEIHVALIKLLAGTVKVTENNARLLVTSGYTITLDLNDKTLDLNSMICIEVEGTLIVKDSGTGGTITGGAGSTGGAICVNNGALTLEKGTITNSSAMYGGGVGVYGGTFTMNGGTISGNTATQNGGGVYVGNNGSTFEMNGGTISGNTATEGNGGGVYVASESNDSKGKFIMNGGTIGGASATDKNTAVDGGGVCVNQGSFSMNGGTISGNTASHNGGGIWSTAGPISGGTITGNTAEGNGGGVYVEGGPIIIGNTDGTSKISITGNTAENGGGVYFGGGATPSFTGSVIINGNEGGNFYTSSIWNVANIFYDSANSANTRNSNIGVTFGTSSGTGVFTSGYNKSFNPNKIFFSDNDAYRVGWNKADGQAIIGAFVAEVEFGGDDEKIYSYESINDAWTAAVADNNGATIKLINTATASSQLAMNRASGAGEITLDLNGYTLNLNGTHIELTDGKLTIKDSSTDPDKIGTITGGNATDGGAIVANGGELTMTGGTITDNSAQVGGGVCVYGASFTMTGGTISNNTATAKGGGVYVTNNGTFTMSGTAEITGNNAPEAGGIYSGQVIAGQTNGGTFTMSGGEISGNTATTGNGGGVYQDSGTFEMTGGTISGNTATNGGGVYVASGGSFEVSGKPVIKDNSSNVYLPDGKKITVNGRLTSGTNGAYIGVTLANFTTDENGKGNVFTSGYGTDNAAAIPSDFFSADVAGYTAMLEKGEVYFTDGFVTVTVSGQDPKKFNTINEAFDYANGKTATVTLLTNLSVTDEWNGVKALTTLTSGEVTLNLGNYTLTLDGTDITVDGAKLILTGSGTIKGGRVYIKSGTFEMSSGSISGTEASVDGGGVYIESGSFTMTGGSISGNKVSNGGGVYIESGSFTMTGGTISNNTVTTSGGGVYVGGSGSFTMSGTAKISGNESTFTGNYYGGGAVYVAGGTFEMTGGTIGGETDTDKNTSKNGGTVYVSGGTFTISGGVIKNNHASNGGGVYVSLSGSFTMAGGTISGNTAGSQGGGVYVSSSGSFTMTGGTITGNETNNDFGGGVYVSNSGTFEMKDGEISDNSASQGGGVYVAGGGMFKVNGSPVIKDNGSTNVYLYPSNAVINVVSLTDDAEIYVTIGFKDTGVFTGELPDGLTAPYNYFFADDSKLAVILNADNKAELTDQIIATATKGEKTVSFGSLDDAWAYANNVNNCEIKLLDNAVVKNNLTASGKTITLDLNGKKINLNSNHFVLSGASLDVTITSKSDSNGEIHGGLATNGGAISVSGGTVTVSNVEITQNTANNGGGVYVSGGTVTMSGNSTISSNKSTGGGNGVYVAGGKFIMASGLISENTSNDTARAATNGGGVYVGDNGAFEMNGGTITGNTATGNGAGVFFTGTLQLGGTVNITGNKVKEAENNVYIGNNTARVTISSAKDLTEQARIGIARWFVVDAKEEYTNEITPPAYTDTYTYLTLDFAKTVFIPDDTKNSENSKDEIVICTHNAIALFIPKGDVTTFEGFEISDNKEGNYKVGDKADLTVVAKYSNPTWADNDQRRTITLTVDDYLIGYPVGEALHGGDNVITITYNSDLNGEKQETTFTVENVAKLGIDLSKYTWQLADGGNELRPGTIDKNTDPTLGDETIEVENSIVRYRNTTVTIEITGDNIGMSVTPVYTGESGGNVGKYTATVTLKLQEGEFSRDYKYVGEGEYDACGMTVVITNDSTATITKVWYIAVIDNDFVTEQGDTYDVPDWTFGDDITVKAPYLEYGDENLTDFAGDTNVWFTLTFNGTPIPGTFYREEFNDYINKSMPVGTYRLMAYGAGVTDGEGVAHNAFNVPYTFTVSRANLGDVVTDEVKDTLSEYNYDGALHLYKGELTAELAYAKAEDRIGIWASEEYATYYDSEITIEYNLTRWGIATYRTESGLNALTDASSKPVNAGEYVIKYRISAQNYLTYGGDGYEFNVKINKVLRTLPDVNFYDGTFTYTGSPYSIYISGTLPEGVRVSGYVGNGVYSDVGEYTVTAKFEHINYYYPEKTAKLTIVKRYLGVLEGVDYGKTTFDFDFEEHSVRVASMNPTVTVSNIELSADDITVSYENNGRTNAGSQDVIVRFEHKNYIFDDAVVKLTVDRTKGTLTGITFNDLTTTYDGKSHSIAISGKLPDGVTAEYINNGKVNAGTYTVTVRFINDNQWFDEMTAKLIINKAKWDGDWTVEFNDNTFIVDGEEHSIYITGSLPDGVTVKYDGNGQKAIDDYLITASFWHMNYYFDDMQATMHIIPVPVVEETVGQSLWWLWLLIGILLFLILVAIILTILQKKEIIHLFTWDHIVAVRTRATVDAAIAAVRANRIDATTNIQLDDDIFNIVPPKPTDPAKLKDYTAYLRLRDKALALEAKAKAIEEKADAKLAELDGEANPEKVEKVDKLREKAAGIRARAAEIKVAAIEKYKSFTEPSEPTEAEGANSENSETVETENADGAENSETEVAEEAEVAEETEATEETEVTEETEATEETEVTEEPEATEETEVAEETEAVEETEVTEETEAVEETEATEETTEQPENENSTEEDGEEPSDPEDNSEEN